jgi:hypothetical protein
VQCLEFGVTGILCKGDNTATKGLRGPPLRLIRWHLGLGFRVSGFGLRLGVGGAPFGHIGWHLLLLDIKD